MSAALERRLTWRNPFSAPRLPAVSRLHLLLYAPSARLRQELPKIALRPFFRLAYRLGLGGSGELALRSGSRERRAAFRGRNLQFSALYLPQHAGGYESETWALLDALVGPQAVFYDIGANWGYFSLGLAARDSFRGRIHAFEPLPETFADLEGLVAALELGERVQAHRLALSDREGEGRAAIPDGLHSGITRVSAGGAGSPVALASVDGLGLEPPSVMKIDVEGCEAAVLLGAAKALDGARPFVVFESWSGPQAGPAALRPFEMLAKRGYEFFHPGWAAAPEEGREAALRLVSFAPEQRGLLREQLNVLAAPRSRRGELEALFPPLR